MSKTIDELWVYVVVHPDGSEEVLRRATPIGTQPLFGDDLGTALGFPVFDVAKAAAKELGFPLKLVGLLKAKQLDVQDAEGNLVMKEKPG